MLNLVNDINFCVQVKRIWKDFCATGTQHYCL